MNAEQLARLLKRMFKGGPMRRLPKRTREAEAILALAIADLDPEGLFDEAEINAHLSAWLDGICAADSIVDYVSLRRQLVDHGFLRRASDGAIYRIRSDAIEQALEPEARKIDPKQVFADVELDRLQRQTTFGQ